MTTTRGNHVAPSMVQMPLPVTVEDPARVAAFERDRRERAMARLLSRAAAGEPIDRLMAAADRAGVAGWFRAALDPMPTAHRPRRRIARDSAAPALTRESVEN